MIVGMIGRLQSHGSMTGSMIQSILEETEEQFSGLTNTLKNKIITRLNLQDTIDEEVISDVNKIMQWDNPFEGLKTYDQQIKAMIEYYGYIEPQEIPLQERSDNRLEKETCTYIPSQVMDSFQYVPFIDVLKMVLSNTDVRQAINNEQPSGDGILGSFIDGQYFKDHIFFKKYNNAIRIKLYYDEIEVVNPLGSKTGVHKQGVFYYQISNSPNHRNSQLSSIHVLLVFCYVDSQTYDLKKILSPFLEDLALLESDEGIPMNFENENYVLRASIESFCGDGLAVHQIFNLLGPSANKFCRLCLYSRADLHNCSLEKKNRKNKRSL